MPEHSPLPFVEGIGCRIRDANNISVALCAGEGSGYRDPVINMNNAAFIVAACNSHEDLVAACEEAIRHLGRYAEAIADCPPLLLYLPDDAKQPLMPILRAALVKATGGDDAAS